MLTRLGIKNFALIDQMNMDFQSGITVITGETGSGKSILIDALSILLGERASAEFIRHGSECFVIEGVFDISNNAPLIELLESKNILLEEENNQLILSRSFSLHGKSLILANDQAIPLKTLRQIGALLADIHGQYSNQALLDKNIHHRFLDEFNAKAVNAYKDYLDAYTMYQKIKKELVELDTLAMNREREMDILKYQLNEIADAQIIPGEDIQITEEIKRFDNYERLYSTSKSAYESLYEGRQPILDVLNSIRTEINDLTKYDEALQEISEVINSAYFNLEEAGHSLSQYLDNVTYDEARYAYCRQRDSLLYDLKKKFGPTLDDVLAFYKKAEVRLDELENMNYERTKLEERYKHCEAKALQLKVKLNEVRHENNKVIVKSLLKTLADLGMDKALLTFDIIDSTTLNTLGAESIELVFAPNKGEGYRPLAKIASGGELSRIALAFSSVVKKSLHGTIVFDEIDVGISGDVAIKVAEKLKEFSTEEQIFCITHMPQTVAIADYHYHLSKKEVNNRTISSISIFNEDEHIQYMASMIAGSLHSNTAIATAKDLIAKLNIDRRLM